MSKPVANKKQKLIIWCGLILLVLATRIGYRYRCPIVTRDAVGFIQWAQTSRTNINQLLTSNVQEPLYPLLLSLSATVPQVMGIDPIKCWEYACVALGIIGTLVILAAVYLIGKHLFSEKVGLLAAFFAALIPKLIVISASGMSEPVFLAFLSISTASMLVACKGGKLARVLMPLAAGMLAVASFLTRKEGLILLPLYVIFLMLPLLKMAWRKRLLVGALLLAGVAVSLWGYAGTGGKVHWLKGYQRFWKIRTFAAISQGAPSQKIPETYKPLAIAKTLNTRGDFLWQPIHRWLKLCPWPIALAAMGYSFVRRKYHTGGTIYLPIGIMLAYLAAIYVHSLGLGFFVGRYLLPAAVMTMPIAAAVIAILAQAIYQYLFDRQNLSKRQAYLLSTCVVLIIALPSLVSAARPKTSKALTILDAARWVKANSEPTDRIFTWERRIPFYAQRQAVQWNPWRFLGEDYRKTAFIVFFQTRGEQWIKDRFFKVLDGGKLPVPKLVKTFRQDHCYDVLVYRLPTRR